MKVIQYPKQSVVQRPFLGADRPAKEKPLFFDIETTGLSAANSTLYLIGVLWYENDALCIRQWFNEDGRSESDLLTAFHTFCKDFTTLVHFNGSGFDLPYLHKKSATAGLQNPAWESLAQLDIYRVIRPYKKLLSMEHMRQVDIEEYLQIRRKDVMTGKELISVYQRYVARPIAASEHLLLLHNHDDLLGMPGVCEILKIPAFFECTDFPDIAAHRTDRAVQIAFSLAMSVRLPHTLTLRQNQCNLSVCGQQATLTIPTSQTTLRYFFEDYKNYYYLPAEDMAIHKSIAIYAEPQNRVRATKSNCYTRKTDVFIPCFLPANFETFREDLHSDMLYQTADSLAAADSETLRNYVHAYLNKCMHSKTTL